MPTRTKFSDTNRLAKCRACGRQTHSSIDGSLGIELCRACYEEAGRENEHNDGHHNGAPDPKCVQCAPTITQLSTLSAIDTAVREVSTWKREAVAAREQCERFVRERDEAVRERDAVRRAYERLLGRVAVLPDRVMVLVKEFLS